MAFGHALDDAIPHLGGVGISVQEQHGRAFAALPDVDAAADESVTLFGIHGPCRLTKQAPSLYVLVRHLHHGTRCAAATR